MLKLQNGLVDDNGFASLYEHEPVDDKIKALRSCTGY